jgi:hypothetical protein
MGANRGGTNCKCDKCRRRSPRKPNNALRAYPKTARERFWDRLYARNFWWSQALA